MLELITLKIHPDQCFLSFLWNIFVMLWLGAYKLDFFSFFLEICVISHSNKTVSNAEWNHWMKVVSGYLILLKKSGANSINHMAGIKGKIIKKAMHIFPSQASTYKEINFKLVPLPCCQWPNSGFGQPTTIWTWQISLMKVGLFGLPDLWSKKLTKASILRAMCQVYRLYKVPHKIWFHPVAEVQIIC